MSTTITITATEKSVAKEHKVFVGNLSFKTTKASLTSFAETSGKVLAVTIIKKNKKSVGYGFITFETENDAENAAKELNHQSLEGREINVEVARPSKASVSASSSSGTNNTEETPRKTSKKRNSKKSNTATAATEKDQEATTTEVKKDNEKIKEASKPVEVKEGDQKNKNKKKKSNTATAKAVAAEDEEKKEVDKKKDNQENKPEEESTSTTTSSSEEAARRKRANQKTKKRQNKKLAAESKRAARVTGPSKTALFIANLPYATTTEDLEKIFADYNFVSAHVARMKHGKSKGYGFIEFANEQNQLKALESVKDVVLEGRSIYIKVAMSTNQKKVEEGVAEEENDVKEEATNEKNVEATAKAVENLKIDNTKK